MVLPANATLRISALRDSIRFSPSFRDTHSEGLANSHDQRQASPDTQRGPTEVGNRWDSATERSAMISLIEFALIVGTASLTAAGASHGWQLLLQLKTIDPRISLRPDRKRTQVGLQPEGSIPPGTIIGIMCCVRRTLSLQKGSPSEP